MGSDPSQNVDLLERDRRKQAYPWPVAELTGSGFRDLKVLLQSTKIAIDSNGVITYRDAYGQGSLDVWRQVLEDLALTRDQG